MVVDHRYSSPCHVPAQGSLQAPPYGLIPFFMGDEVPPRGWPRRNMGYGSIIILTPATTTALSPLTLAFQPVQTTRRHNLRDRGGCVATVGVGRK